MIYRGEQQTYTNTIPTSGLQTQKRYTEENNKHIQILSLPLVYKPRNDIQRRNIKHIQILSLPLVYKPRKDIQRRTTNIYKYYPYLWSTNIEMKYRGQQPTYTLLSLPLVYKPRNDIQRRTTNIYKYYPYLWSTNLEKIYRGEQQTYTNTILTCGLQT
ncbi:unnamed protein product [Mytilus coruscus]|uniref:Uncharacterized protein n=1 Tax=Mytilus coruscus TaxID=42192 RepID=A0A6J8DS40_MYTCO|nr:unnamed protein product [Mytilus coruscus]